MPRRYARKAAEKAEPAAITFDEIERSLPSGELSGLPIEERLDRIQKLLMIAIEHNVIVPHVRELLAMINGVCRIHVTLRPDRRENRKNSAEAGSAVRRYAQEFTQHDDRETNSAEYDDESATGLADDDDDDDDDVVLQQDA